MATHRFSLLIEEHDLRLGNIGDLFIKQYLPGDSEGKRFSIPCLQPDVFPVSIEKRSEVLVEMRLQTAEKCLLNAQRADAVAVIGGEEVCWLTISRAAAPPL